MFLLGRIKLTVTRLPHNAEFKIQVKSLQKLYNIVVAIFSLSFCVRKFVFIEALIA